MTSTDKGSSSSRLATIRLPRDMTLGGRGFGRGGAAKRKYAPVIPKGEPLVDISIPAAPSVVLTSPPSKKQKKSEERRFEGRGRGRGRHSNNLIQTKSTLEDPLKQWALDNQKEKYSLPSYRESLRSKRQGLEDEMVEGCTDYAETIPMVESMLEDAFFNLTIPEEDCGKVSMRPVSSLIKGQFFTPTSFLAADKKSLLPEKFFFVTLPDHLPGMLQSKDLHKEGSSSAPQEQNKGRCLADFSEGPVGKLRIRKSGKVELVLGENVLEGRGSDAQCYQEAAVLDARMDPPQFFNFGRVAHHLDFRPDVATAIIEEYKRKNPQKK